MDILRVVLLLLLVSFTLFQVIISARNDCPVSGCRDNHEGQSFPSIRFPFKLQGQPKNCGYPGFDLSCSDPLDIPTLSLPYSGEFFVRDINYLTQELHLSDPQGCLPGRLLNNLNLSSSPFMASYYRNYTFLSCSTESLVSSKFTAISCLSNSTTSILATSSLRVARAMNMCTILVNLAVPVSWPNQNEDDWFSAELNGDLALSWNLPSCTDCEAKGDLCGFANSSSQEITCFDGPKTGGPRGLRVIQIMAATLVLPAMACSMTVCFVIYIANRSATSAHVHHTEQDGDSAAATAQNSGTAPSQSGLDDSTIETYKKVELGESLRLSGPNDNTCPICLTDYKPRETVRCIPDCQHCFHSDCIDEWLRMNSSCPVCRCSPKPANTIDSSQVASSQHQVPS